MDVCERKVQFNVIVVAARRNIIIWRNWKNIWRRIVRWVQVSDSINERNMFICSLPLQWWPCVNFAVFHSRQWAVFVITLNFIMTILMTYVQVNFLLRVFVRRCILFDKMIRGVSTIEHFDLPLHVLNFQSTEESHFRHHPQPLVNWYRRTNRRLVWVTVLAVFVFE